MKAVAHSTSPPRTKGLRMDTLSTQIASRTFDIVKRGYEPGAVDAYLRKIGDQVGKLEDAIRVGRKHVEALELRTKDVVDADTVVRTAFLAATSRAPPLRRDRRRRVRRAIPR